MLNMFTYNVHIHVREQCVQKKQFNKLIRVAKIRCFLPLILQLSQDTLVWKRNSAESIPTSLSLSLPLSPLLSLSYLYTVRQFIMSKGTVISARISILFWLFLHAHIHTHTQITPPNILEHYFFFLLPLLSRYFIFYCLNCHAFLTNLVLRFPVTVSPV